jgi:HK97 family phage major capsid protein
LLNETITKLNKELDAQKSHIEKLNAAVNRPAEGKEGQEKASDEYSKAFVSYLRKGIEPELKALSVNSDPDGGYLVSPTVSQRIITIVYESSPVRQLATVETISTDSLDLLEDRDQMASGWTLEVAPRGETNTAQLGKKTIPVHELFAQPKATQKVIDDAAINIEQWIAGKVAERFARDEATAFVAGDGQARPRGFLTYAAGTSWGQIQQVASGTNGTFDGDDILALFYALKEPYMSRATWMMNRAVVGAARTLKETTTGQYLWQPGLAAGQPDTLVGRPVVMANDMPVAATDSLSIAVGDFQSAYTIVDRLGIRTLRDPFTEKPFVKFYTTKRVGGDVTNFEAIKLMKLGS